MTPQDQSNFNCLVVRFINATHKTINSKNKNYELPEFDIKHFDAYSYLDKLFNENTFESHLSNQKERMTGTDYRNDIRVCRQIAYVAYHLCVPTFYLKYKDNLLSRQEWLNLFRATLEYTICRKGSLTWYNFTAKRYHNKIINGLHGKIYFHMSSFGDENLK